MYIIYINIYKGDSFGLQNTRVLNVLTTTACSVLISIIHNLTLQSQTVHYAVEQQLFISFVHSGLAQI